jgi:glycosyltransferase involved in cell wall biosynthesis
MNDTTNEAINDVAVVVPVYRGEKCLAPLVEELVALAAEQKSPDGRRWRVAEVLLVHDCGPDRSDRVIRDLAAAHPDLVRPIWLSRNFGQHAATLAGFASSAAPWVVTLDEDGQHDPGQIGVLLDAAFTRHSPLVYAHPQGGAPHAGWRNATSDGAKRLVERVSGVPARSFSSYRLVLGEQARAVAAYCGQGTYLDVALHWVVRRSATVDVAARDERRAGSGYDLHRLLSHFTSMVLNSGTRPLRIVATLGFLFGAFGLLGAAYIFVTALVSDIDVPGWASITVTLLVTSGATLFSLGVIAEYVGSLLRLALGRPLYVMVTDPADTPLGADPDPAAE